MVPVCREQSMLGGDGLKMWPAALRWELTCYSLPRNFISHIGTRNVVATNNNKKQQQCTSNLKTGNFIGQLSSSSTHVQNTCFQQLLPSSSQAAFRSCQLLDQLPIYCNIRAFPFKVFLQDPWIACLLQVHFPVDHLVTVAPLVILSLLSVDLSENAYA